MESKGQHSSPSQPHGDVAETILFVHGPRLGSYAFGSSHPLQPSRHMLTMALLSALGWLDRPGIRVEAPRPATLTELLSVHFYPYVQAVQRAQAIARGQQDYVDLTRYGLGTADNPIFPDIHDAAALYTGATIQAMSALVEGRALHTCSPAGGQHHAQKGAASGFCVYNDLAAAIAVALAAGLRVAYLDIDAHHGDGVQAAFYDDPRVLTVSLHESGRYLFPGTGDSDETGRGPGLGTSVNVPLPPSAGDEAILLAFDRIGAPAVRAFSPDLLLVQTGVDTHHADPLTHLNATMSLYPELARRVHDLAHQCCAGRMCVVGGGYDPADVTPRAWAAFWGTLLGREVRDLRLPREWLALSRAAGGDPPPTLMGDQDPETPPLAVSAFRPLLDHIERAALGPFPPA